MGEGGVFAGGVGECESRRFVGDGFEGSQPVFGDFGGFLVVSHNDFERHELGFRCGFYALLGMAMTRPPSVASRSGAAFLAVARSSSLG